MKNRLITILSFLFLFYISVQGQQQNQNLKTEIINGVEYYVYTVQPREGLYRISVNFGVSQEEITSSNPEVKEGLKSGQVLFIPKKNDTPANNRSSQSASTSNSSIQQAPSTDIIAKSLAQPAQKEPHFNYHKVEKKQTLYSISKLYDVTQDDIIKYNPQAVKGIQEGEVLRVPKAAEIYPDKKEEKAQEDYSVTYLIHIVEPKETLYSISKKYNVKIDDILKINPSMEVLSIGQELRIPYYPALITTEVKDGRRKTYINLEKINFGEDTLREALKIAYLLPFSLENKNDATISRFVDFYAGSLKSINEAKQIGVSLHVFTYDTGKTREKMEEVFAQNEVLKEMDLIIGPAYSVQVPIATEYAKKNKIKILIPFTSKVSGIEQNPYIFQFNPGDETEIDFIKTLFSTRWNNMNYIFADIENVSPQDEGFIESNSIKNLLKEQRKTYHAIRLSDPEINMFDSVVNYDMKNFVIFNTDRFSNIQPYLKTLNLTDRTYDVLLFEQYNWKSQTPARPVGVYIAPFRPEDEMSGLTEYNEEFQNLFNWIPTAKNPRYDLLGYDLTNYFIPLLLNEDTGINTLNELMPYMEGIQSQFNFKRSSPQSGFINQQLYVGDSQVK